MVTGSETLASPGIAVTARRERLEHWRQAHLWLLIPLVLTLGGFAPSYFGRFSEASWQQHLHGLSATAWFILMIVQPWLATRGRLIDHRRFGLMALLLAGFVVASALGALPGNITGAQQREDGSFISPSFLYGVTYYDLLLVSGFAFSVAMAALRARVLEQHAWWMVSTVFWILGPGLARLLVLPLVILAGIEFSSFTHLIYVSTALVIAVLIGLMLRQRRAHPALVLALLGNLAAYAIGWFGDWPAWRALCDAVFLSG